MNSESANLFLADKLMGGRPFFVSRLGYSELDYISKISRGPRLFSPVNRVKSFLKSPCSQYLRKKFLSSIGPFLEETYHKCDFHFYETDPAIIDAELYVNAIKKSHRVLLPQDIILPTHLQNPWLGALNGKKVLVISPFVDDFQRQLNYYKEIWSLNQRMAPSYTFLKYKMPFYFDNWVPAFDEAKKYISNLDFDIALIGAGPVANLLGLFIRDDLKRQSMNIGGALQLYYGIIGQRWIDSGLVDEYLNCSWIRPSLQQPKEVGKKADNINYW